MTFTHPDYVWFLVFVPLLIFVHFISIRYVKKKALQFANFVAIERATGMKIITKNYTILALRIIILVLFTLGMSGMTLWYESQTTDSVFALAIDVSGSMLAKDMTPNRIEAAKKAAESFIETIPEKTKVAILTFAGVTFVKTKPTDDKDKLIDALNNVSIELVGGTAIGSAIINSINLLVPEKRPGVVVLLTDGQNNVGPSIEDAIEYAKENHVVVHTIGVGTKKGGRVGDLDFISQLDEKTLMEISNSTGGIYYYASNTSGLSGIYKEIAESSKKKISLDLSIPFMLIAFSILLVEWLLLNTRYRTLP